MAGGVLAAGCLAAAVVAIAIPGRATESRLRAMWPSAARRVQWSTAAQVRLVGVLAGGTVAVLLGGVGGVVGGVVAALVATAMWSRWVQRTERAARARAGTDLPLAADLLAAALRAGAPVDRAAGAVGLALGGSLGERLERVGRALRLGATAAEAWAHVTDVGSGDRLARAAVRSAASGAALAAALERLAEELRAARLTALDAAARRAGVLVVLPLGLCFLPAFVLAGLVPVIVAVLGDVL